MNKIYKVIWSKVKHQYVVVSELAHSNGKQSRTSRNSIRSRIAALVVCGAIAAFGVFSALPNSAYAATAAETTSGQYIAVALADTNEEDVAGQWYNKNSTKFGNDYEWNSLWGRWVECDNTRTFKDATGALHTYTKQTINNKTYWVREGYSISAEEGNRFTAYDEHRNPIAPENTYIIDSQKSDDADDVGLISSSQVVISDDSKHTTLTGNPLNNIEPGIYGGASNGGGTEVPVDYHYYIDNNGKGWVNIGKQEWNDFTNPNSGKGYFQEVYAQKDGSYNTKEDGSGISVSSEYLYAIDKTSTGSSDKSDVKLGAFFNSNGTLYTGNVYGNNNEVLMTGVENGTYYSYWGTKINDLNTSLSEMTVGDLNRIVGGINDTIYTAQGDDIKQVSVQKSQDNNGGTIGLIRRGDWNGTTYSKIDPVPGTITVTSTGGTDGSGANNDVKIKFSNTDEDGTEHSFTVDAGSKVEGLKDGNTANPDDTLTGIKINGETYQLGGGKTYSPGQGIAISDDDNKISVRLKVGETNLTVDDTGLALNKDLTVDSVNAKGTTIDKKGLTVGGTTYVSAEGLNAGNKVITNVANGTSTYDAVNFSQLETVQNAENYVKAGSIDNASGTITLNRVQGGDVTISGLQDYVNEKDSYVTAAKLEGNKLTITQNNQGKEFSIDLSGLTSGLSGTDYQLVENPTNGSGGKYTVDDNGNLTLTVKDLNNPNAATKPITITGLAKKTDVAVVHGKYREGEANNLVDTNAQIGDEAIGVEKSSSIALGNGAFVSVQNGRKADAILFGSDTYTGGIAIGENSKALNATVNIGVKDYKGKMGDVDLSDYKTYEAMGVGETSIGSNSYISGSLSTNIGSYNITTTKYGNTSGILGSLYSAQNFGSVIVGTLNSIESNSSSAGMTSGVANSVIGMANKTQNSNGSLVFGTGNEITNSTASIPSPSSVSGDVADVAENFRDSVSDRNKSNGGAVLAIGGGNKADYAQNSQLIGVQNEVTGTSKDISEFNMVNGYQNTVTNGSNDTVIGTKNTVTNSDSNVVLGDNHAVQDADNNVILGSSDKETTHTASDTVVIGHNAQANGNNDVAIGSGSIANRAVGTEGYAGANPIGTVSVGSEGNERTITNVAAGRINEDSTDAVNGSQLYATNQKVDAGWTATDGTNDIKVNPKDGTTTLKFAGDNNIAVTADTTNKAIQVALNDKVYLGGDHTEDSHNIVLDGDRGVIGLGSTIALDGRDGTAVIGGVNITTTAEEGTGKLVSTINGLSNTTWTGTTETPNRVATEGQLEDLSDTVNTGWIATDSQNHEVNITPDNNKLNFAGDENITVTAANNEIKVALNDDIVLGDYLNGDDGVLIGGSSGTISATNSITVGEDQGLIIDGQKKEIQGLSNTTWNEKIANDAAVEGSTAASTAATQGQLQEVSKVANAGWTASDGTNSISVKPNETLNFVGDENLTVSADGTDKELKVSLNDDITLGDGENAIKIDGTNGTLNIGSTFVVAEDGTVLSDGDVIADADGEKYSLSEVGKYAVRYDKTNDGTSTITLVDGDDLSGTRIKNVADGVDPKDAVNVSQLEAVEATANAGWTASDGTNSISIKPNETLNFVGDENLTVSADGTDKKLKVSLNDNITLGNGQSAITLNGSPENSNDPALSVGTDKFVVDQDGSLSVSDKFNVDAETGNIYAANNSGSAIMMNDDSVALNAGGNGIAISDEGILLNTNGFDEDIKLVTKGTSVSVDSNGTTFTNVNTNETTNIDGGTINVGDRLMVEDDGSIYATNNNGSTVMINDNGVALNSEGNGVVVSGEGITLNTNGSAVTVDRFNGTTFTNTNTGETTNINGGTITTNTVKGLDNTTWSEDLAEEVANNEELQGTAATQGQLQQAVNEVAEVANAGWNAKAGGNTINVKPNETLNFEGDGNITVSATDGTSNELKFGLNDNITLGDKTSTSITLYTDPTSETTVVGTDGNTTNVTGYVPESYKSGTGADFVKNNGGFALFTTDTQGHGIFGVTTKGTAHGKDFVTYTKDIYNNSVQYSLNDVGNIVTQISHAVFDEGVGNTGMEYTLISDFEDEADKDSPFDAKEGKTRTIGLAVRQDGAVIVGAVVNDEGISSDRGIRINAETKTTYDENDNEVTNNIATITGLENTEWKPPTPVATFAANDGSATVTSRAATESQLNDLYSAVAAYDVNVDGTIDYSHIALAGTPYGASRSGNGTHTGGTSITNVAYASGKDGSEAVNVDYLNDAINNAVKDGGAISDSDRHLQEGTYHVNDQGKVELIVADEKGENQSTVTIDNIANKNDITNLDNKIDNTFNDLNDKINNIDNVETDVKGGNINEDGTISLKTENEDGTTTNVTLKGQLTDSGVVQEGTSFDKETGTITITSQDKYSGETSSVKVEGIASTDVVGATNKEDLATAYKDADKDGNATTEYITDSESMVEADVALDHAIQDVAGTSYANDMVLSNRIDSVEKRLGNVEERIDKVGAMAAAIANLRTMGFDPEAPTEIAIGVGQYKSETGIAIGVFHYPNQDFMLSASLSSSGDELMGGIGATWKLGRKSAAERAKDEEARHLEQAEEMKKLAQQEKVKAQAQRHAKLLAERQQASQKNA